MRSRYSAYRQGEAEYLFKTTHPNHRSSSDLEAIKSWSAENSWVKLEVLNTEHGLARNDRGVVEFRAHFTDQEGERQMHHERSRFLKEEGRWYYVDGIQDPPDVNDKKIARNDPCPCGSGKKYKRCCG